MAKRSRGGCVMAIPRQSRADRAPGCSLVAIGPIPTATREQMMADEFLYSVRGPKSWMMMTSYELADALKETDVALVPCGAIENHAGGLPLGQDNFQIEEVTR